MSVLKTHVKVILAIFIFIAMSVSIQRYAENRSKSTTKLEVSKISEESNLPGSN